MKNKKNGYFGNRMSKNAYLAHQKGEFPLSIVNAKLLRKYKFNYSVAFFRWLCKKGYIKPASFHHTGVAPRMTRFYSVKTVEYVVDKYNLTLLYDMYRGRINRADVKKILGIRFVKIKLPTSLLNLKSASVITIDAVLYQNIYFISKNKWICQDVSEVETIAEWELEPCSGEWKNIYKDSILRKITIFKNIEDILRKFG